VSAYTNFTAKPGVTSKFAEAEYVLHAFLRKTQKTAPVDIELARQRFRASVQERKQR
jgi:phage-related protein